MSLNQKYNKTITFKPTQPSPDRPFDLCFLTYYGKLTKIVDHFNKLTVREGAQIVKDSFDADSNRNCLEICSFLNFSNIFLYLLTYDADPYYCDANMQSTWHIIGYRGHTKLLGLLLNHERYKMKIKALEQIDNIKRSYGFSNLDIVKGKLSRAVHQNETNKTKFINLQKAVRDEAKRLLQEFINKIEAALTEKDKQGQTPLHLAAMSKFPLSHLVVYMFLDFEFFKYDETWDDYLAVFEDLQGLEIKQERMYDPRRCMRLERELMTLLGENVIKNELSSYYHKLKTTLMKKIINMQDKNGDSILHISAFHGDFRIVNKLVFFGGNKKLKNQEGKLPVDLAKDNFVRKVLTNLNKAAKASDEKNITELVNFGKDINEKISIFSQAPIHKIIESKDNKKYEVLKKMLEMGADPNTKDSNGWTALHYACQFGDMESVKILTDTGAYIDTYSNNKRIPLHLAANMNYPEIVKYLLEKKSNPNYKDELGCTPMHLAAKQGNTKCIEYLLFYGADLYALDFRGWNILHYSAFHGHKQTVRFISKYDADYDVLRNTKNSQNKMPIEIVRDPSVKPWFVSLWHAAKEGDLDMTRNLINGGENVDEQTQFEKNTPLHLAVLNNHYLLVRLLVEEFNCKIHLKNKDGVEAVEYAKLMDGPIKKKYEICEDMIRETFDLRDIVRDLIHQKEEVIDATVCKSNWKLRVWAANDFSTKILKLFEESGDRNNDLNNDNNSISNESRRDFHEHKPEERREERRSPKEERKSPKEYVNSPVEERRSKHSEAQNEVKSPKESHVPPQNKENINRESMVNENKENKENNENKENKENNENKEEKQKEEEKVNHEEEIEEDYGGFDDHF